MRGDRLSGRHVEIGSVGEMVGTKRKRGVGEFDLWFKYVPRRPLREILECNPKESNK